MTDEEPINCEELGCDGMMIWVDNNGDVRFYQCDNCGSWNVWTPPPKIDNNNRS